MSLKDTITQNIISHEIERFAGLGGPSDGGATMGKYLANPKTKEKFVTMIILPFARQLIGDDQLFVQILEAAQHDPA